VPTLIWIPVKDGNPAAFQLMKRHYTFHPYSDGRRHNPGYRNRMLFVGPGEKMVLLTPEFDALFVWRRFINKSGQQGINCAAFRNEGDCLSSELILAAEEEAWNRWPGSRLYTYIDPTKINSSNPGYCFKAAGWKSCGFSKKRHLLILEKFPCQL
jgi:hypothetical protein